jgi:hypothetical protein
MQRERNATSAVPAADCGVHGAGLVLSDLGRVLRLADLKPLFEVLSALARER